MRSSPLYARVAALQFGAAEAVLAEEGSPA
jgi:hypothetical protein